jgi:hypothetical protein
MPGTTPGALRVAHCSADTCGPLVEWRVGGAAVPGHEPETPVPAKGGWPGWVMATIFGGGVVASMAIALAATGAFDKTQGTEPHFVNGGVKTSARR